MVVDVEELENLDPSDGKEVITPKRGEIFILPIADATAKLFGESTPRQIMLWRVKISEETIKEVRTSLNHIDEIWFKVYSYAWSCENSCTDGREARNDFVSTEGNDISRYHVEPRVQLYVPKIPNSTWKRYIDVTKTTHTTLDVFQESRIDH